MPYVSRDKFLKLQRERIAIIERADAHWEKAVWYSRRHSMLYGHEEIPLRNAIYEYLRKRDLKLDYHQVSTRRTLWSWWVNTE